MLLSLAIASPSLADEKQDLSMLTVERIFAKRDFEVAVILTAVAGRWLGIHDAGQI